MKRVEADNAWEVGRNTTGTFDISSYSYGAGTYAFAVAVTGGTNYNDAQSTFGSYVVDDSGSGGSIWGTLSLSLAGDTEPAPTTATINKPRTLAAAPIFLSAKVTPTLMTLAAEPTGNATMILSPDEVVLNRGREFEVTLSLDQAVDIWGILAAIDYDPDALELLGYTFGDIFTESQFTVQERSDGSAV